MLEDVFKSAEEKKETALFLNVLRTDNVYGELLGYNENKSAHHESKKKLLSLFFLD